MYWLDMFTYPKIIASSMSQNYRFCLFFFVVRKFKISLSNIQVTTQCRFVFLQFNIALRVFAHAIKYSITSLKKMWSCFYGNKTYKYRKVQRWGSKQTQFSTISLLVVRFLGVTVVIKLYSFIAPPLYTVLSISIYPPSTLPHPSNHHIVAHVHEFFLLLFLAQCLHPVSSLPPLPPSPRQW